MAGLIYGIWCSRKVRKIQYFKGSVEFLSLRKSRRPAPAVAEGIVCMFIEKNCYFRTNKIYVNLKSLMVRTKPLPIIFVFY